jgi:hypothetical protein
LRVQSSDLRVESSESEVQDRQPQAQALNVERSTRNVSVLLAFMDMRNAGPLQQAAAALRASVPGAEIICINTPATKAIEARVEGIDRWITLEGGLSAGLESLGDLRHLRPAATCILYQAEKSRAHLKLEVMAAVVGGSKLLGAFSTDYTRLLPMKVSDLWLRIAGKTLLVLLRAGAGAALAAFVALFLAAASLLTRPGERLGMPGVGRVK